MIDKSKKVKVINKFNGTVGYSIPESNIHRNFYPRESRDISFEELEQLTFVPGGDVILREYLEIADDEAVAALFGAKQEPEYHYSENDIKNLMLTGSLDQFLDCLDYAPSVVKDIIKDMAVKLPLNDVSKRDAIREKLGFDVTKAIEIKNTKYDGGDDAIAEEAPAKRRVPVAKATGRRYQPAEN